MIRFIARPHGKFELYLNNSQVARGSRESVMRVYKQVKAAKPELPTTITHREEGESE